MSEPRVIEPSGRVAQPGPQLPGFEDVLALLPAPLRPMLGGHQGPTSEG